MPRVGLEPTISAGERPKIYALDRAATGTGLQFSWVLLDFLLETYVMKHKSRGKKGRPFLFFWCVYAEKLQNALGLL